MSLFEEWVEKAEGDYKTAVILNRPRKEPQPDSICYHCQQSAEKYLKAFLLFNQVNPPRTHNLLDLLTECITYDVALAVLSPLFQNLNPYSVQFRYPGDSATVLQAKTALTDLRRIRKVMRKRLGL